MLRFEVRKILLVLLILRRLLVLGHLSIILLFSARGLFLKGLANARIEHLPSFSDEFSNFSKGKVLALQLLADFCSCQLSHRA